MARCCPSLLLFLLLHCSAFLDPTAAAPLDSRRRIMRDKVRKMFYHAYENYMTHAFPHDELKPLDRTFTDSLSELGNLKLEHLPSNYSGSALTLIESLSSLVIMGNHTEFERAVLWLSHNLHFDVDARINLFECNIRVLGGLLSAHILATDSTSRLAPGVYKNQLLDIAEDLGRRFLFAFDTPSGLPYAWINLKASINSALGLFTNKETLPRALSRDVIMDLILPFVKHMDVHALIQTSILMFPIFSKKIRDHLLVNLRYRALCYKKLRSSSNHGVMENEITETSTSGCGSLILEMGALSQLTGDPSYEEVALRALHKIWSMRSPLNLMGTTLDVISGEWIEYSSGIGAGVDSYYEYLLKGYILFGKEELWSMFQSAYIAVQRYFRHGPWYHEADMRTGRATYWQLTSLQAFWPGLQTLIGDVAAANSSHREFFNVWKMFGVLPERYLLDRDMLHPTERYYPLRPELAESTFYLFQATKDPWYLEVGEAIMNSLNRYTKADGGYASIRDVTTMQKEDHQHSFFLSETCKYLYLLFDDSFLANQNYIFTTEGHLLPVKSSWHDRLPSTYFPSNWTFMEKENQEFRGSPLSQQICPANVLSSIPGGIESACHVHDLHIDHRCKAGYECGTDSLTCRRRTCSMAGYCGLWLL